jgi:hypothetical protein
MISQEIKPYWFYISACIAEIDLDRYLASLYQFLFDELGQNKMTYKKAVSKHRFQN